MNKASPIILHPVVASLMCAGSMIATSYSVSFSVGGGPHDATDEDPGTWRLFYDD